MSVLMVQPAKLNREMIVREAIALLQEGGLEALTLRRVASRLNARAPSLARHVGDKNRLLALVSATIFGEALDSIAEGLKGDEWLAAFGHALQRKQAETRDITALIAAAPANEEIDTRTAARLHEQMRAAGLEGQRAQLEQTAIQALVTGWMLFETSARGAIIASRRPHDRPFEECLTALIAGFAAQRG